MFTKKLVHLLVWLLLFLPHTIASMKINATEYFQTTRSKEHIKKVKNFLMSGKTINNTAGSELLFEAITLDSLKSMRSLLQYGVNPNLKKGNTLLRWALESEDIKKIALLLQYGAHPTREISSFFAGIANFMQANTFGITKGYDMVCFVALAQENWLLMSEHAFDNVCTNLFEKYPDELSLFYNLFFAVRSKKQFKEFERIIQDTLHKNFGKKCTINLEQFLMKTASPQLLTHFLERGIFIWNDTMLRTFKNLQQKKNLLFYRYCDAIIAKVACDIGIHYKAIK